MLDTVRGGLEPSPALPEPVICGEGGLDVKMPMARTWSGYMDG